MRAVSEGVAADAALKLERVLGLEGLEFRASGLWFEGCFGLRSIGFRDYYRVHVASGALGLYGS